MRVYTAVFVLWVSTLPVMAAQEPPHTTWRFAASGDSRNCGDVVMPAIAASAKAHGAAFFWHLGDYRMMVAGKIDQDLLDQPSKPGTDEEYYQIAWSDFVTNQLLPFGNLPVFLTIGNHETYHKTRSDYLSQFREWLNAPQIAGQRQADDPSDAAPRTYYHWIKDGIDFIALDDATPDQFDASQTAWFEKVLDADRANKDVQIVVVGMHKPLPDSLSYVHGASETGETPSIHNGQQVYQDLWKLQNESHKKVYILASHSHYFMEGNFNTDTVNGRILPGIIIGTAGAERYPLPSAWRLSTRAMQNVYGYLLATVNPSDRAGELGAIRFEFELINRSDLPEETRQKFSPGLLDFCFDHNFVKP